MKAVLTEVTKINLAPDEILGVTIKSDEIDLATLNSLKTQFKVLFPKNKVILFGVGQNDDVKFSTIKKVSKKEKSNV